MSKTKLHTNLIGRTVRFLPWVVDIPHFDFTEDERAEVVAAYLMSDGSGVMLLVQRPDGTLREASPIWVAVEGES